MTNEQTRAADIGIGLAEGLLKSVDWYAKAQEIDDECRCILLSCAWQAITEAMFEHFGRDDIAEMIDDLMLKFLENDAAERAE